MKHFPQRRHRQSVGFKLDFPYLWQQAVLLGGRLFSALLIGCIFWILAGVAERLIQPTAKRMPHNADLLQLLGRSAKIAFMVFGFVTVLGTMGVNVQALVAGLGLTGFALGFALRDVLSNVLAGVLLLLYRPFHRGDHIATSGLEGRVIAIDLRYTTLSRDQNTILIPNANLFTNPIVVSAGTRQIREIPSMPPVPVPATDAEAGD